MREQLLQKQRELLQLQKQKIELELRQTEATIEQQNKQLSKKALLLKDDLVSFNHMMIIFYFTIIVKCLRKLQHYEIGAESCFTFLNIILIK